MIVRTTGSDNDALDISHVVPSTKFEQLVSVAVNWAAAPTTSESLTITFDSVDGPAYDTLLYTVNPSLASTTDVYWWPEQPTYLKAGDAVRVQFTNTDARIWGVTITVRGV